MDSKENGILESSDIERGEKMILKDELEPKKPSISPSEVVSPPLSSFICFWESKEAKEYKNFSRSHFDFYTTGAIYAVGFSYIGSRYSLEHAFKLGNFFLFTYAFMWLTLPISSSFFVARIAKAMKGKMCGYQVFPEDLLERLFWGHVEDVVGLAITLTNCFYLYARVNVGQCQSPHIEDNLWYSQWCNPFANSG